MINSRYMINDVLIKAPVSWKVTTKKVTTSYSGKATLDGTLHYSVIRTRDTIQAKWGLISATEKSKITELVSGNAVSVRYPESVSEGMVEKVFYVDNISAPLAKVINGITYWSGLTITLTEV